MPTPVHGIPVLTTFDPPPGYVVERVIGPCWGITEACTFAADACSSASAA